MKQIFTLLSMGMLCLASKSSFAQVNETFATGLPAGCWQITNFKQPNGQGANSQVIITQGFTSAEIATPFINLANTATISFNYELTRVSSTFTNAIIVGIKDKFNNFVPYQTINISTTGTKTANVTIALPDGVDDVNRVALQYRANGTATAEGNTYIILDNLTVTGNSFYYSSSTPCNNAPNANDDNATPATPDRVPVTVNVLINDTDPNSAAPYNEVPSIISFTQPAAGTGIVSKDPATGMLTFTPDASFLGGVVTFTYTITDNGYNPLSDVATVTITYPSLPEPVILPIHLLGFQGSVNKDKVQISWSVADNETGDYFEIQKSAGGKKFENIGIQFTSNKVGTESYTFSDPTSMQNSAFYRLKVVNKDYSTSYSKIIRLQTANVTADNKITLLQNPVQSSLTFSYTSATAETNEINIYNIAGVKVYSQKVMTQKGSNSMSLNLDSKLTAGSYVVEVAGANTRRTTKFVKF